MKKTILTMFIATAATLMVACGGRGTNEVAPVATDSICDSVATEVLANDSVNVDSVNTVTEVVAAE